MNITKVQLAHFGTIDLPIVGALPTDPYILKHVAGLGPPEVDVSMTENAIQGSLYNGSRPRDRQLVLTIGLNPNYNIGQTVADMRAYFYGALMNGRDPVEVNLFEGVNIKARALGHTSKVEPAIFAKEPVIQITIECPSPYLSGITPVEVAWSDSSSVVITNPGNAPTGFLLTIVAREALVSPVISIGSQALNFLDSVLSTYQMVINTVPGSRDAYKTSSGGQATMLGRLGTQQDWPMLFANDNILGLTFSAGTLFDATVEFIPQYWGV